VVRGVCGQIVFCVLLFAASMPLRSISHEVTKPAGDVSSLAEQTPCNSRGADGWWIARAEIVTPTTDSSRNIQALRSRFSAAGSPVASPSGRDIRTVGGSAAAPHYLLHTPLLI